MRIWSIGVNKTNKGNTGFENKMVHCHFIMLLHKSIIPKDKAIREHHLGQHEDGLTGEAEEFVFKKLILLCDVTDFRVVGWKRRFGRTSHLQIQTRKVHLLH
jgi:hypothetical protein